jgi:hypothetical protein
MEMTVKSRENLRMGGRRKTGLANFSPQEDHIILLSLKSREDER